MTLNTGAETKSGSLSTTAAPREVEGMESAPAEKSYGQILKSSTIIGGSSVVNVLMGIVRSKVNAVLLGPGGVGLIGLYSSIFRIVGTLTGMGIGSSGVRQIAEAAGTGDRIRIARTIMTLRRVALFLGLIGALALFLFRKPVCQMTFGNLEHVRDVGLLAVLIFLGEVASGQAALIQGVRRIGDLARRSIIGAVLGTMASATIIYFYRERGILISFIAIAILELVSSWWFARKIQVEPVTLYWKELWGEARPLLALGLVMTFSGLIAAGGAYVTQMIIVRQFNLAAVGLYGAAMTLSSVYVRFILQAMGADFYPRLTAVAKDHPTSNRLVNEQAEVGLLLAVPGILATLTFAPLVIHAFYAAEFIAAADILRWEILGVLFQVASWPMGFILLAKELKQMFFWTELASGSLYVGLVYFCLKMWGLPGAGIAFFANYLVYWGMIFLVARRVTGFTWSQANARLVMVLLPAVALVFLSSLLLSATPAIIIGSLVTLGVAVYNFRVLRNAVGSEGFEFLGKGIRKLVG
jgi:enterobacterial common antigen flippase